MREFIFTWSIRNIGYSWHKTGETIYSPAFTAVPMQNSVWNLQLNPRGSIDDDYLSLFLQRSVDNGPEELSVNFELSCLSSEKSPLYSHFFPESDQYFKRKTSFGHPRFLRRHEVFVQRKSLYMPRDTLTVRCRMWKDEGDISESGKIFGLTCLEIERILSVDNIKPRIGKEHTVCIHSELQNKELISISLSYYEYTIGVKINPTNVENIKYSILKLSFVKKIDRKIFCEHRSSCLGSPVRETWRLNVVKHLDIENEDSGENDVELLSEFTYSTGQETKTLEKDFPFSPRSSELVSKYINSCISSENLSDCPRISQDLWNLYAEHVLCDLELKTETSSFFVHKIVLCARSPVFLAMLSRDMKEKRNECIDIEDIMDDILKKFLFFLYTDTFEDLEWEAVIGLYYAADKYHVERLKILCSSFLLKNIDVENVCELLLLADRHHDSDFKRRVEDFILQNDEKIFSSSIWKQFVCEQSLLSAMTMLLKYDKERVQTEFQPWEAVWLMSIDFYRFFLLAFQNRQRVCEVNGRLNVPLKFIKRALQKTPLHDTLV
ncbi:Speckle-type POZ protein [Araneus ventricosus]|uniref:Speckle-type POZ protein n=1 Tax=Araneus ventricosus TaxID=182803 RepID=A0A4Y2P638_ARAVE|nr:Speckle-type POZ protein [Araneus ventricosus]